jgi:hypothetical protein
VPAIGSAQEKSYRCARCGSALRLDKPHTAESAFQADAEVTALTEESVAPATLAGIYDAWEINEQLRHIERVLNASKRPTPRPDRGSLFRFDPPQPISDAKKPAAPQKASEPPVESGPPVASAPFQPTTVEKPVSTTTHLPPTPSHSMPPQPLALAPMAPLAEARPRAKRNPVVAFFGWTALAGGVAAFACGAVLAIWGLVAGRDDLWNLGLPIVVAGQLGLLAGIVLQLDVLWQNNRETAEQLDVVDRQLTALRHRLSEPR